MKNNKPQTPEELRNNLNNLLDNDNNLEFIIKGEIVRVDHRGRISMADDADETLKQLAKEVKTPFMLKNTWKISLDLLIAQYIKLHRAYEDSSK